MDKLIRITERQYNHFLEASKIDHHKLGKQIKKSPEDVKHGTIRKRKG